MAKERGIGSGSATILVVDKELSGKKEASFNGSAFTRWLKSEGFKQWSNHGFYDNVNWVYVNINSKIYAPSLPGIPITEPLGEHAVTVDEFKQIYAIFKKYEGK